MKRTENLYFKNSIDLSKYPGKDNVIARMVLIHMVVAATAFLMSFPPALIQELSKHSGAAPGTHAAIPLFQITIGSVTNWLGSVAGYVFLASVDTALTYNVAKISQRMLLIVVSVLLFHTPISMTSGFGIIMAMLGVFLYTAAKKHVGKKKQSIVESETRSSDQNFV